MFENIGEFRMNGWTWTHKCKANSQAQFSKVISSDPATDRLLPWRNIDWLHWNLYPRTEKKKFKQQGSYSVSLTQMQIDQGDHLQYNSIQSKSTPAERKEHSQLYSSTTFGNFAQPNYFWQLSTTFW